MGGRGPRGAGCVGRAMIRPRVMRILSQYIDRREEAQLTVCSATRGVRAEGQIEPMAKTKDKVKKGSTYRVVILIDFFQILVLAGGS